MKNFLAALVLSFTLITTIASARVANQVLRMGAAGNIPAWGAIDLSTSAAVTGQLPVANGGTGAATKAPAFDALSPMTASQDFIYGGASGTGTRLPVGANGTALTVSGGVPAFVAQGGGGGSTFNANIGNGNIFPLSSFTSPAALSNLPSTFSGSGGAAFSPDGRYLAATDQSGSPFIYIFRRYGDFYLKLANPGTLPTGSAIGLAWSPDSKYLAVNHNTSPFITVYERVNDTFTKLTNPATLPTASGNNSPAWSPDGRFLTVGSTNTPFILTYERTGSTLTKLANPASLPSEAHGLKYSRDGRFLAVGQDNSVGFIVYSISGSTFTKLSNPASLPTQRCADVDFSPGTDFLACSQGGSPFIENYSISGSTFTKLSAPASLPDVVTGDCVSFSPDGTILVIVSSAGTTWNIYDRSGNTFTKRANPTALSANGAYGCGFSADQKYFVTALSSSPGVRVLKTASSDPVLVGNSPKIQYKMDTL